MLPHKLKIELVLIVPYVFILSICDFIKKYLFWTKRNEYGYDTKQSEAPVLV